ncbi:MAG: nucleotide exchange factor GrpE, partial [Thermoplasmata archaeon]|nr:nucleotide exchange factor GrpE [Thermoplasmata archaeon]
EVVVAPPRGKKKGEIKKKGGEKEEATQGPIAKKIPIPEGAKRKILEQAQELRKLKHEVGRAKRELNTLRGEVSILREELNRANSEKMKLEQQVLEKEQYIAAYDKKLKRLQKDFEKFKERVERERDTEVKRLNKKLFLEFIEIKDTFERAIEDIERRLKMMGRGRDTQAVIDGLEGIRSQINSLLKRHDIEEIDPVGEKFDPRYHEAMDVIGGGGKGVKIVREVLVKGYRMGDYLLRPAKVVLEVVPGEEKKEEEGKGKEEVVSIPETEEGEEPLEELPELEEESLEELEEGEFEELSGDFEELEEGEFEALDEFEEG